MDPVRLDISSAAGDALRLSSLRSSQQAEATSRGSGFGDQLATALKETDSLLSGAEHAASDFAAGRADSIDTIITMSKADLALRHLVTLRNRALEAYREIMQLPL